MFALAVIVSLIGCALSQDLCCSPDQWECTARVGGVYIPDAAGLNNLAGTSKVAYDWTNKRVVFDSDLVVNGTVTQFKIIRTFTETSGTQYLIEGDTCFTEEIPRGMTRSCVPGTNRLQFVDGLDADKSIGTGDAVEEGTYNLGVATNSLRVTARIWEDQSFPYQTAGLSTAEGCVPVLQGIVTNVDSEGSQIELAASLIYGDVTPGIQDDAVFTPPSTCTAVKTLPEYIRNTIGYRFMTQTF